MGEAGLRRVLRPGAVLVAWCIAVDLDLAPAGSVGHAATPPYEQLKARLHPYEDPALVHVRSRYRTIQSPGWEATWHEVPRTQTFSLARLVGFLGTISAYAAWLRTHAGEKGTSTDPLEEFKAGCAAAGLDNATQFTLPLPYFVLVYRPL